MVFGFVMVGITVNLYSCLFQAFNIQLRIVCNVADAFVLVTKKCRSHHLYYEGSYLVNWDFCVCVGGGGVF